MHCRVVYFHMWRFCLVVVVQLVERSVNTFYINCHWLHSYQMRRCIERPVVPFIWIGLVRLCCLVVKSWNRRETKTWCHAVVVKCMSPKSDCCTTLPWGNAKILIGVTQMSYVVTLPHTAAQPCAKCCNAWIGLNVALREREEKAFVTTLGC